MTAEQYRLKMGVGTLRITTSSRASSAVTMELKTSNLVQAKDGSILGLPDGMNKTELAYARHLQYQKAAGVRIRCWYFEPTIWRLPASKGKRNTFRPDFLVVYEDGIEEWVEIKAGWRVKGSKTDYRPGFQGDGRTKLVTFAGAYPHLRVVLRWFHKYHSTWEEERFNH